MVGDNHFRYQAWTNLSGACWTARVELFQTQNGTFQRITFNWIMAQIPGKQAPVKNSFIATFSTLLTQPLTPYLRVFWPIWYRLLVGHVLCRLCRSRSARNALTPSLNVSLSRLKSMKGLSITLTPPPSTCSLLLTGVL